MAKFIELNGYYTNIDDIAHITPPRTISGSYSQTPVIDIHFKQGGKINIESYLIYDCIVEAIKETCEVVSLDPPT